MSDDTNHINQDKGWAVDKGKSRDKNEDSVLAVDLNMVDSDDEKSVGIYAVADGMGGEEHGEIASSTALHIVVEQIIQSITDSNRSVEDDYRDWLTKAVHIANHEIFGDERNMGTTLVAAVVVGNTAYIANVGDSRAYMLTNESMRQITEDQTLVQALLKDGQIDEEQAARHPFRNVLMQAVGQNEQIEPDLHTAQLDVNNYLLLCSDGLTKELDEAAIYDIIMHADSTQAACDRLVEQANQHGGRDNISVILVKLSSNVDG